PPGAGPLPRAPLAARPTDRPAPASVDRNAGRSCSASAADAAGAADCVLRGRPGPLGPKGGRCPSSSESPPRTDTAEAEKEASEFHHESTKNTKKTRFTLCLYT